MTVKQFRSALRQDAEYYAKIKLALVLVPGRKAQMTVKELRSEFRRDPDFYDRIKNKEFAAPKAPKTRKK